MANPYVIDFSAPTNALARYAQQGMQGRKLDQDQAQFLMQNALARDQFGEVQKQHGIVNTLARDRFGLEQAKSPYELALLKAQANTQNAHAGYYNAAASAKAAPVQTAPAPVIGMREDGSQYIIDAGNGAADVGGGAGDDVLQGAGRFGARGLTTRDVPGIVTNARGGSDRYATEAQRGQAAIENHPDVQRLNRFTQNQELWTRAHGGRPRAGMMYDEYGREVPKGPLSNAADTAERKDRAITNMMGQIDNAEKTLKGSWNITRSVAKGLDEMGTAGRFIQPQRMEELNAAYGQYKEGVLQTVYALSGKQTTNKEMEAFLNLYMPQPGESDARIAEKTGRLKKMLGTLRSATKRGMIYEDAEREALAAAAAPSPRQSGGPPQTAPGNPAADRLKSKYGLE